MRHEEGSPLKVTDNRARTAKPAFVSIISLMILLAGYISVSYALPAPLSPDELQKRSDLVIEGRVTKVWLYSKWLTFLKKGGLGAAGAAFLRRAPATDREMLSQMRNFPYKSSQVAIEGVYLAEVQVDRVLKGSSDKVIFIPFVRYNFLPGRRLIGPWAERSYQAGEHLQLDLIKNGPFFESTWWNAVKSLN
jgi:hypothetical protein